MGLFGVWLTGLCCATYLRGQGMFYVIAIFFISAGLKGGRARLISVHKLLRFYGARGSFVSIRICDRLHPILDR